MSKSKSVAAHRRAHRVSVRRRGEDGFTLVELMVSLTVFMIGLMGIVSMQVTAANQGQNAGELTLATNLATAKLDELRLTPFDSLASGNAGFTKYGGDGGTYFTVAWTAVGGSALKDVTVTTTWQRHPSEAPHNITFSTKLVP